MNVVQDVGQLLRLGQQSGLVCKHVGKGDEHVSQLGDGHFMSRLFSCMSVEAIQFVTNLPHVRFRA